MSKIESLLNSLNKKYKSTGNAILSKASDQVAQVDWISTNIYALDRVMGKGLPRGRVVEIWGSASSGKALPNTEVVVGENGYTPIGSIKVGDKVYGEDGELHNVVGVFPQGNKPVYRLFLRSGDFIDASIDHLWKVQSSKQRLLNTSRIVTTKELLEDIDAIKGGNTRYSLPVSKPVNYSKKDLPIDPKLLGYLLGDGGFTCHTLTFTNVEKDIIEEVKGLVKKMNCSLKRSNPDSIQYRIVENNKSNAHPLKQALKHLGLLGKYSGEKFIPDIYKCSSIDQRISLLCGLINTDGSIPRKSGSLSFSTSSERLFNDVCDLVASLGMLYRKHKIIRQGEFSMGIYCKNDKVICGLSSKHRGRLKSKLTGHYQNFVSYEYLGEQECTCIKVDNPTELFLTNHYTVTHNTTSALQIIAAVQRHGGLAAFVDAEQTYDAKWAAACGVDNDNLVLIKPEWGEQALSIVESMIDTGEMDLIVVDSIPGLLPKAIADKEIGSPTVGEQARMMSIFLQKITPKLSKTKTSLVLLNQTRTKIGVMYGDPTALPGGAAVEFYSSVILKVKRDKKEISYDKITGDPNGHKMFVKNTKNKVSSPFRETEYMFYYNEGVDNRVAIVDEALAQGIIVTPETGRTYTINADGVEHKIVNRGSIENYLTEHPDLAKYVMDKLGLPDSYKDAFTNYPDPTKSEVGEDKTTEFVEE